MQIYNETLCPSSAECHSGYLNVDNINDAALYYILVKPPPPSAAESLPAMPPSLIIALNGGPGVSSLDSFFYAYGPITLTEPSNGNEEPSIETNKLWLNNAISHNITILFVDQPAGVGFGYSETGFNRIGTVKQAAEEFVIFLRRFYKQYRDLISHKLYFAGESFAGTYIPYIIDELYTNTSDLKLDIHGVLLSSAWVDSAVQYLAFVPYARQTNLVPDEYIKKHVAQQEKDCYQEVKSNPKSTILICDSLLERLQEAWQSYKGKPTMYFNEFSISLEDDNRGYSWPPNIHAITQFLNREDTKKSLNCYKDIVWKEIRPEFHRAFLDDNSPAAISLVAKYYKNISFNFIVGTNDIISNLIGIEWALGNLTKIPTRKREKHDWMSYQDEQNQLGHYVNVEGMRLWVVNNGSHMMGYDKPVAIWSVIRDMLKDNPIPVETIKTDFQGGVGVIWPMFVALLTLAIAFGFRKFNPGQSDVDKYSNIVVVRNGNESPRDIQMTVFELGDTSSDEGSS